MQVYHEQAWKGNKFDSSFLVFLLEKISSESLCGCFNDGHTCCYGCCCCCCLYGQNAAKIDSHSRCITQCCVYSFMSLLGCCCLVHTIKRGQLREKYGLEEGVCGDCFITCCCPSCAICQEAREMKVRGMIKIFF
jgi:Cys-rich protein (TIGR01571 family)